MSKPKGRWPILAIGTFLVLGSLFIKSTGKGTDWAEGFVLGLGATMIICAFFGLEFKAPWKSRDNS